MTLNYRTPGPWGPGVGANLTPAQVDNNFWMLQGEVNAKAAQGVGIADFIVSGNQMTVVLTDHTHLGPYALPVAQIQFVGAWTPNHAYLADQIFTEGGSTYITLENHTSQPTFDPGANDGQGHDYYGLLLSNPAASLPSGGVTGAFLRKASATDFSTAWRTAALDDLSDVAVVGPVEGEGMFYIHGQWTNAPSPAESLTLEQLTDVAVAGPANGHLLTYNSSSSKWTNQPAATQNLAALGDVALTTPANGQPLVYNGTQWIDTSAVDLPCGGLQSVSGAIFLYRTQGEVQRLQLTGTVTAMTINGWPPGGQFARLVLEVQNTGGFGLTFPSGTIWPGGTAPSVTANGKDIYILCTFDGGATIYGNTVGQNYHA